MEWHESIWDGEPTVVLRAGATRLEVAHRGATVLGWRVPDGAERPVELAVSYPDTAALERNTTAAFAVLAPFPNRIAGGTYGFDGARHDLRPGMHPADAEVSHGLVRRAPWRLARVAADDDRAAAELTMTIAADGHPGYPFDIDLIARYTLTARSLRLELTARNTGERPAPVVLGWHPYLRLPGHETIDGLELDLPATGRVRTDDRLIPLPGGDAYERFDGLRLAPIGTTRLDDAFTAPDEDAVTVLRSPLTGDRLELHRRGAPVVHVFTGDVLAPPRSALALEPVGAVTNAFNRTDCADHVALAPGAQRTLVAELSYVPVLPGTRQRAPGR